MHKYFKVSRDYVLMKAVENAPYTGKRNTFNSEQIKWLESIGSLEPYENEIEDRQKSSYLRTKRTLRDIVENNILPMKSWFVTLTFSNEHLPKDREGVVKKLRNYMENLRVQKMSVPYVAVIEGLDGSKRYHIHMIVFDNMGHKMKDVLDKWKRFGYYINKRITYINNEKLTGYLLKYITKEMTAMKGVRFYFASKGLKRTEIVKDLDLWNTCYKKAMPLDSETYESEYQGIVHVIKISRAEYDKIKGDVQ